MRIVANTGDDQEVRLVDRGGGQRDFATARARRRADHGAQGPREVEEKHSVVATTGAAISRRRRSGLPPVEFDEVRKLIEDRALARVERGLCISPGARHRPGQNDQSGSSLNLESKAASLGTEGAQSLSRARYAVGSPFALRSMMSGDGVSD